MSNKPTHTKLPKHRFPEFRNAGEWEEKLLKEIASIIMGSSPKSEFYNDNQKGLPLLQGNADIKNRLSTPRIFTSQITKECLVGDILLSVRAPVGTVAKSNHHACIGRGIAAIRANKHNSQEYLYQWLLSFESQWKNISQGGTFDAVNSDEIKLLRTESPPPKEQQKIADCFASVDELITLQSQKLDALQKHKKGLMQQLFPIEGETLPKLRFPEFHNSARWKTKKLKDIVHIRKGQQRNRDTLTKSGEFPVWNGGITPSGYTDKHNAPANSITISNGGNSCGFVNYSTKKFWLGGDCFTLEKINSDMCPEFLFFFLKFQEPSIMRLRMGSGLPHVYKKDIEKIEVKHPDFPEQQKITDCLSSVDDLITVQSQKLDALKDHKKGLMQQLFPSINELAR